ncbi:hypothetical protein N8724_01345 [Candidatus Pelagibacter sp.]|nr:hypothetical protein [Candidatus Pelagibacter sp.]
MKKLFSTILVLSLMLSGNAYAKDVKLICNGIKDDGISHVVIINDKKRTIKYEVDVGSYEELDVEIYNKDEIDANVVITLDGKPAQQLAYNIDRRSGVLFLRMFFFVDGSHTTHRSNCEPLKENKF